MLTGNALQSRHLSRDSVFETVCANLCGRHRKNQSLCRGTPSDAYRSRLPAAPGSEHYLLDSLVIGSPKRKRRSPTSGSEFFPYYAGFPESFARDIIESSSLPRSAAIFDPWNGSGTTTYSAAQLGYHAYGIDLNPVMVLVARARNLPSSEADSIVPQAKSLIKDIVRLTGKVSPDDPLLQWFSFDTANVIRNLEARIRSRLIGRSAQASDARFDRISCFAATFYVALFTICRTFTRPFRSSNPTWLKTPKTGELKLDIAVAEICSGFLRQAEIMAESLQSQRPVFANGSQPEIAVGNSTQFNTAWKADLILTSPPYCTRIDYTAATRIELAVVAPLLSVTRQTLSSEMIGSVRVPTENPHVQEKWGRTCVRFLEGLNSHGSKASRSYYYKTHADYFDKMARSIHNLKSWLKPGGAAVLVVQDSYYKNIHNDVPTIVAEMAENAGLVLRRREDFLQTNSISGINSKSRKYRGAVDAIESVICFSKRKQN